MSRVLQIGNFGPEHSTESHLRQALAACGHEVIAVQENDLSAWEHDSPMWGFAYDAAVWTRTGWDWESLGIDPGMQHARQMLFLERCEQQGIPTVSYHLDRWWGLGREHEVVSEPFFRCSLLVTADGGHDKEWADAGVRHHWLPPAVSEFECRPGSYDDAYFSEVAFVGSWIPGYHAEWQHRPQLIEHLRSWYGPRVRFWPAEGQPAIRGAPLRDLYASTLVNVGDSCLVPNADGSPVERYWSDRVPETIGRGGLLIHPKVEGLDEAFEAGEEGLLMWHLGDWDGLRGLIEFALERQDVVAGMRERGRARVLADHTYTVRMRQVWDLLGL
jgi:hypothetical protein